MLLGHSQGSTALAHVGEQSHRAAASAGQAVPETLALLQHIPSEAWLGFGWIHESTSLKQKEYAQAFSEGDKRWALR